MAYFVIRAETAGDREEEYYCEYLCEAEEDITSLPTAGSFEGGPRPGSLALIETDASLYILTCSRQWAKIRDGASS